MVLPIALACVAMRLLVGDDFAAASPDMPMSEPELRSALAAAAARVDALAVEYEVTGYAAEIAPPDAYFHKRIMASAPASFRLESGHGRDAWSWQDDPHRQLDVIDGEQVTVWFPIDRTFSRASLAHDAPLPGSLATELFVLATGLWPCRDRPPLRLQGAPAALAVLALDREYALRPALESVAGRPCHVLAREGRDVVWIDVARGCCIVQREARSDAAPVAVTRLAMRDFEPAAPDVWLPRSIEGRLSVVEPDGRERQLKLSHARILEATVAPVDPAVFVFVPPAGALESRGKESSVQVAPGGSDLIEELAAWSSRMHASPVPRVTPRSSTFALDVLALLAGAAVAIAIVQLVRSRDHARDLPSPEPQSSPRSA